MPIEQVLMQIRDDPSLQWPKPISTLIEIRDKSKYYGFHQDHGHCADECKPLKDQVETLIRQGKDNSDKTPEIGDTKPLVGKI